MQATPRPRASHRETNEPLARPAPSAACAPAKARCEIGMRQPGGSTRHQLTHGPRLRLRAQGGSPRPRCQRSYLAPGQQARQDPKLEQAPVRELERATTQELARESEQESAPAPRPMEAATSQGEERWRAAPRVPGEGWGHSAAGASRVGRRTCRRRRPGCRDGRRACRAPLHRTARRPRSDRPRRPTALSGRGARRDASTKPYSRPTSRS